MKRIVKVIKDGVDYLYPGVLFNIDEEQYDKLRLFVKIR